MDGLGLEDTVVTTSQDSFTFAYEGEEMDEQKTIQENHQLLCQVFFLFFFLSLSLYLVSR